MTELDYNREMDYYTGHMWSIICVKNGQHYYVDKDKQLIVANDQNWDKAYKMPYWVAHDLVDAWNNTRQNGWYYETIIND